MLRSPIIAGLLFLVLLAGCRSSGNQELLERELRSLEDLVYELEDALHLTQEQLHSSRRENAALRREIGGDEDTGTDRPILEPPSVDLPSPEPYYSPPEETEPLPMDPGLLEDAPPFEPMPGVQGASYDRPADGLFQSLRAGQRPLARIGREDRPIDDWHVANVRLNSLLTGGLDADGHVGDEGVLVVLEPRNAEGQILSVAGEVSIVVLDPSRLGNAARVARWDYSADETADLYRDGAFDSQFGRGIHFRAMWPGEPPESTSLRLYVRYVTADGKRFQAEQDITIDQGGGNGQWAAAPADGQHRVGSRRRPRWVEAEGPLEPTPARAGPTPAAATASQDQPEATRAPRTARRSKPLRRGSRRGWSPDR